MTDELEECTTADETENSSGLDQPSGSQKGQEWLMEGLIQEWLMGNYHSLRSLMAIWIPKDSLIRYHASTEERNTLEIKIANEFHHALMNKVSEVSENADKPWFDAGCARSFIDETHVNEAHRMVEFWMRCAMGDMTKQSEPDQLQKRQRQHASKEMKSNENVVMAAVQENGFSLQYASEEMKSNEKVVMAAVQQ